MKLGQPAAGNQVADAPTSFPPETEDGRPHRTNRGVGLYGSKVFFTTHEAVVVAPDAVSGKVVWKRAVADYRAADYTTMAPLVASGKVMVGASGGEWGVRGFVAALDPDTGEELWRSHTIPEPGQTGSATWPAETWRTGGGAVWITGSDDPELNLTYWGTGNPGPWIGDQRQGDNLYANSVVAFDADSGALKGYHQYHHHGSWDWDEVSAPMLIDAPHGDRTIPALIHPGRNGYFWMLERSADSIRFVDAWPYVYQDVFTGIDRITGRPEYDPGRTPTMESPATFCPSISGGRNWPPAAYSPKTGYVYIPANENFCSRVTAREEEYQPGQLFVGVDRWPRVLVRDGAYAVDGTQYIAVQSGWGGDADYLQWVLDEHFGEETSIPAGGASRSFRWVPNRGRRTTVKEAECLGPCCAEGSAPDFHFAPGSR